MLFRSNRGARSRAGGGREQRSEEEKVEGKGIGGGGGESGGGHGGSLQAVSEGSVFYDFFLWLFSCVNGEHDCVKSGGKGQSCALCAKAKQKCVMVVWAGGNTEPSRRSKGGSGSTEIAEALMEIVKVLKFLRRDMVMGMGEIVDAIDKEYLVEELSEEDSEPELEMTLDELTELAAESKEGEMYQEWLVETGRVMKTGVMC